MEEIMSEHQTAKPDGSTDDARLQENLDKIRHKLIVISGKGGVGKSTVAVNVAYGLALAGKKVGILDVDIHGPSIAKMLGIEGKTLQASSDSPFPKPIEVSPNLYAMTIASLIQNPDEPIIWRGPLKMGAIRQFLQDIRWPELDYLVVDSPPGTGDEPLSVVQLLKKVDGSLIVSTPQDIALLDARKTIKFSGKMGVPVIGLIENMSTFVCPHCGEDIDIFKGTGVQKAAADFGVNILGKIPMDAEIVSAGDEGRSVFSDEKNAVAKEVFQEIVEKIMREVEK
jgi:ATP-binding protein involved in chromosome partitioning